MEDNTERFRLVLSTWDSNQIQIGNSLIKGILCEKLPGVKADHKVAFDQNIKSFGKEAKAKLKTLARVVPDIVLAKKNLLMNSFFPAQFSYCAPIRTIHSRFRYNWLKCLSTWRYLKVNFFYLIKTKIITIVIRAMKRPT